MSDVIYDNLPWIGSSDYRHAWDLFGADDQLGSLNRLTPERRVAAFSLARTGTVVPLGLPLNQPKANVSGIRGPYKHRVALIPGGRDDRLDRFYLQGSSHWDALNHMRFGRHGYYGGRSDDDLDNGRTLGIDAVARQGVFGTGVLLDVASYMQEEGVDWAPDAPTAITPELLDRVARSQRLDQLDGDILLIRTGWLEWFMRLSPQDQSLVREPGLACAGLAPTADMAGWLWDHHFVAVGCDNPAVEKLPGVVQDGFLHTRALTLLGILLGEYWDLRELSEVARRTGQYSGLFISCPLNIPGGTGSPANAFMAF